jgi:hypothetical protein
MFGNSIVYIFDADHISPPFNYRQSFCCLKGLKKSIYAEIDKQNKKRNKIK